MKLKTLTIFLLLVLLVIFCGMYFHSPNKNKDTSITPPENIPSLEVNKGVGIVTKNEDGSNEYVNTEIGFSFLFSPNWVLARDDLPTGVLQLFNYADDGTHKKGFDTGGNKIEAMLVSSTETEESPDYPEKNRAKREVLVNNQKVVVYDIELERGDIYRSYIISLPTTPDKYLSITIYGDTSNFQELDEIVESYATIEK